MLRNLSLTHYLWTFGAYLVLWLALSISILHILEVDYQSSFFAPASKPIKERYHVRRNITVEEAYLELYNFSNCYRQVDFGILDAIQTKVVCSPVSNEGSKITHLPSDAMWSDGSVWQNFGLDLRGASAMAIINDPSEEGASHDPRFKYASGRIMCHQCALHGKTTRILNHFFPKHVNDTTQEWRCDHREHGIYDTQIEENAILIARKDEHNPFYQISAALNAWAVAIHHLGWSPISTRVIFVDDGSPMATDNLLHKLLGASYPLVYGKDLVGKRVGFKEALFVPFEHFGSMMQHLDDEQPCYESYMVQAFRDAIFEAFQLKKVRHSLVHNDSMPCTITIISRRPYNGRDIDRMWANEDDIVAAMRDKYGNKCTIESIDFGTKTMAEQISIVASSRIIIGMHGAGLANILFASPHSYIIEIFPILTERYGYRNMCQYLGLEYIPFRGGIDTILPFQHKTIAFDEWFRVFDLVMDAVLNRDTKDLYEHRKKIQKQIHQQHILDTEFPDL
ncbi:hypothetical protein THRCLA_00400 [Thraustotheca clavata]|uniref:Glycosyltransferase 61 catalytic domain-containing protein n=1 Tax=Thraustotheca clavata TaxID=74557 RepID=A0A1W0ABH7_9STRA|nr:hypothetical protein THRCLA_00400 [Thraustotheca clavata]